LELEESTAKTVHAPAKMLIFLYSYLRLWLLHSDADISAVAETDQNMMQFGRTVWLLNVTGKV
jgi:hypothetical protein